MALENSSSESVNALSNDNLRGSDDDHHYHANIIYDALLDTSCDARERKSQISFLINDKGLSLGNFPQGFMLGKSEKH